MTNPEDKQSKYNIHIEQATGVVIGDQAQVNQHFSATDGATGPGTAPTDQARLVSIADQVQRHFNLEEIRDLCFRLGVDYDDLGGEGKRGKVRELVGKMERNGRLAELVALLKQLRGMLIGGRGCFAESRLRTIRPHHSTTLWYNAVARPGRVRAMALLLRPSNDLCQGRSPSTDE